MCGQKIKFRVCHSVYQTSYVRHINAFMHVFDINQSQFIIEIYKKKQNNIQVNTSFYMFFIYIIYVCILYLFILFLYFAS